MVLGVRPGASEAEIRAAYRRLARLHHPDHGGATQRMARVNAAYSAVRDGGTSRPRHAAASDPAQSAPPSTWRRSHWDAPPASDAPAQGGSLGRFAMAIGEAPFIGGLVVLVSAAVFVRVTAVLLGPPLNSAWFLQLWVAVTVSWLTWAEFDTRRRTREPG